VDEIDDVARVLAGADDELTLAFRTSERICPYSKFFVT
jgi:hypothetical protein